MTEENIWETHFQAEINQAEYARSEGNEGMARVCARRAVGIVLGEYFRRNQIPLNSPSVYDRLRMIEKIPGISADLLIKIEYFLVRVNPDYTLPVEADLIVEAQQIRRILLGK
jgi:hypothetical protein